MLKKYHTVVNYQIEEKYYTGEKMLPFIQISLTIIYTHLGETCHKYSILIYQCCHYFEDQSIHIYMELLVEVIFVHIFVP